MDFVQADEIAFEMATVLDEIARVKCKGIPRTHRVNKGPVACSYFLESEKFPHSQKAFWKLERPSFGVTNIDSFAGLGFIYNRKVDDGTDDIKIKCAIPGLRKPEAHHYIDLKNVEEFAGLNPEFYPMVCESGFKYVEQKEPKYEKKSESHVNVHKVIEVAKDYISEDDIGELRAINENLNALPGSHPMPSPGTAICEDVNADIDKLLQEKKDILSKKSEEIPYKVSKDFRWLSVSEEASEATEPEDLTYGWVVTPEAYSDYEERNELPNDLKDVTEVADFFVDNILNESRILVDGWEKGTLQQTQAKGYITAMKIMDSTVDEILNEIADETITTMATQEWKIQMIEELFKWKPDAKKSKMSQASIDDLVSSSEELEPLLRRIGQSETIIKEGFEPRQLDTNDCLPLSRSLGYLSKLYHI